MDGLSERMDQLNELDKQVKTLQLSKQFQGLYSFSSLLSDHKHDKLLCKTALLKLSVYWKGSSNYLIRQAILNVVSFHSFSFLSTHTSDDDEMIVKTIDNFISVLDSNDPKARSLTLRVLGYLSDLSSTRIELYHRIHSFLESKSDPLEFAAAIFITRKFCLKSTKFAHDVFFKIIDLLKHTEKEQKMQLISLLSKMTFDVGVCKKVLEECHELLHVNLINGELELCLIILNTCTRIAEECVFELSGHIKLLFEYVDKSHDPLFVCGILFCLKKLCNNHHFFPDTTLKILLTLIQNLRKSPEIIKASLSLLDALVTNELFIKKVRKGLVSVESQALITNTLVVDAFKKPDGNSFLKTVVFCKLFFDVDFKNYFETLVSSIIDCKTNPLKFDILLKCLILFLSNDDKTKKYPKTQILLKIFASLPTNGILESTLIILSNELLWEDYSDTSISPPQIITLILRYSPNPSIDLSKRLLQSLTNDFQPFSPLAITIFQRIKGSQDSYWDVYETCTQFLCLGKYRVVGDMLQEIVPLLESENTLLWISSLSIISRQEYELSMMKGLFDFNNNNETVVNGIRECLNENLSKYRGVYDNLLELKSTKSPYKFQIEFITLKLDFIYAIIQTLNKLQQKQSVSGSCGGLFEDVVSGLTKIQFLVDDEQSLFVIEFMIVNVLVMMSCLYSFDGLEFQHPRLTMYMYKANVLQKRKGLGSMTITEKLLQGFRDDQRELVLNVMDKIKKGSLSILEISHTICTILSLKNPLPKHFFNTTVTDPLEIHIQASSTSHHNRGKSKSVVVNGWLSIKESRGVWARVSIGEVCVIVRVSDDGHFEGNLLVSHETSKCLVEVRLVDEMGRVLYEHPIQCIDFNKGF